jgi:hypothetical protein
MMRPPRGQLFAATLLCAVALAIQHRAFLLSGFGTMVGDLGDGRIALALMEHWSAWMRGEALAWHTPFFFHPAIGTLGFTDTYFLHALPYALARGLGASPEFAGMASVLAFSAAGMACVVALCMRHLGLTPRWGAVAACLFVTANMVSVKLVHVQVILAFALPGLILLVLTAWQRGALVAAFAAGLLFALMAFSAFQTAFFAALVMLLGMALHPLVFGLAGTRAFITQTARRWRVLLAAGMGAGIGLAPFVALYGPVIAAGRRRDIAEVMSNAPSFTDIINITGFNLLWGRVLASLGLVDDPARPVWEVEMGYTPMVLALLLAALLIGLRQAASASQKWLVLGGLAALASWLIQLDIAGLYPWALVHALVPGGEAIRYTFRSQIVANLAASLLVTLLLSRIAHVLPRLGAALAAFVLVEQVNTTWPATLDRHREKAARDIIQDKPPSCAVFVLAPVNATSPVQYWEWQAQAMMIAQTRRWPTINGYLTWLPEGWDLEQPAAPGYVAGVRAWAARHGLETRLCTLDATIGQWTHGLP